MAIRYIDKKKAKARRIPHKPAVQDVLSRLGFDPAKFAVFDIWDRELKAVIPGCQAVGLQGTKLFVQVPSAVHRHEVSFLKERLIHKVNNAMGKKILTDVRFELGSQTNDPPARAEDGMFSAKGGRRSGEGNGRHINV